MKTETPRARQWEVFTKKGGGKRRGPKRDATKDSQVLSMRAQGMTFKAIADVLGVTNQCVSGRYHKALKIRGKD